MDPGAQAAAFLEQLQNQAGGNGSAWAGQEQPQYQAAPQFPPAPQYQVAPQFDGNQGWQQQQQQQQQQQSEQHANGQSNGSSNPVTPSGEGGKKRRSRWGPDPAEAANQADGTTKKRKSRWEPADETKLTIPGLPQIQLPAFVKELMGGEDLNPEVQALNAELNEINRKLQTGEVLDLYVPPEQRSPSPEPMYDNLGHRVNTREVRAREKLMKRRSVSFRDSVR
jgi:hypothetical protein